MHQVDIDDVRLKRALIRKLAQLVESGEASPPTELLRRVPRSWSGVVVASASPHEIAPQEIYRSACRSVVAVGKLFLCSKCGKRHASTASGFVIAKSGLVVTNFHVVDDSDKEALGCLFLDGTVYPVQSVVCADRRNDLAVLQVPADDLVPLPLGDEPAVGAPVYVLSHPAGRLFTFTAGTVSRYFSYGNGRSEDEHTSGTTSPSESRTRLMTITADFGRGSSGAPVLDARGAVVGVARKTKSIYHNSEDDAQRRLQMVLKHCVPLQALRDLGLRSVTG
jgi:S1-C subfamily serine protease